MYNFEMNDHITGRSAPQISHCGMPAGLMNVQIGQLTSSITGTSLVFSMFCVFYVGGASGAKNFSSGSASFFYSSFLSPYSLYQCFLFFYFSFTKSAI